MERFTANWFKYVIGTRIALAFVAVTILAGWAFAQSDNKPTEVGEGCLLYRSPVSGRYEQVPLVHTDAVIDVRGLVAAATVTQQYANSSSAPIEAVYIFPASTRAAVHGMKMV